MALIKCSECGKEISESAKTCPHCGHENYLLICKECGYKITDKNKTTCPNCGIKLKKQKINKENTKKFVQKHKPLVIGIFIVIILAIIGIITNMILSTKHEQLPVKVDISMTSYYGNIDNILEYFGLDFDLVTSGANCYTGVQKGEYRTEKYGILHTEFRYCKTNRTQTFRIYNDNQDQELRDPQPGELPEFDKYGDMVDYSNNI